MLRSEIFVSEDGQLLVADLVLDYEPLSHIFQDASQALRVGNPRFARIDVSKPGFLAQRDLPSACSAAHSTPASGGSCFERRDSFRAIIP